MKIDVVTLDELTAGQRMLWSQIQQQTPLLDSPYCHPGFTEAMSRLHKSVRVGILQLHGQVVGFFPFETVLGKLGQPIGGRMSDFQAVIIRPEIEWSAEQVMRDCGLSVWDFDRLCGSQTQFLPHSLVSHDAAHVDLAKGFDHYLYEKQNDGSGIVRQTERKLRKLQREVGRVEIVADTNDPGLLDQLMIWKSAQYQRTKVTDVFGVAWTGQLLADLLSGDDALRGSITALVIDDQPVAIHYGLRSNGVLHCWFPAYDEQLAKYSPGAILFMELIRACPGLGIRRVDLGGVSQWKSRLMNRQSVIRAGSVDRRPVVRELRRGMQRAHRWLRESPLRGPARIPWRAYYHLREWMAFRGVR